MYVLVDTSATDGKPQTHTFSSIRELFFWTSDKFRDFFSPLGGNVNATSTGAVGSNAKDELCEINADNISDDMPNVSSRNENCILEGCMYKVATVPETQKTTQVYDGPPRLSMSNNIVDYAISRPLSDFTHENIESYIAEREKALEHIVRPRPQNKAALLDMLFQEKLMQRTTTDFCVGKGDGDTTSDVALNMKVKPDIAKYSTTLSSEISDKLLKTNLAEEDCDNVAEMQKWFIANFCENADGVIAGENGRKTSSCVAVYYCYMLFLNFPEHSVGKPEFIDNTSADLIIIPKFVRSLLDKYTPAALYSACSSFGKNSIQYSKYFRNFFGLLTPLKFKYPTSQNNFEMLVFKTIFMWYNEYNTVGQELIADWVNAFMRDDVTSHNRSSIKSSTLLTMFQRYIQYAFTDKHGRYIMEYLYKAMDYAINAKTFAPELKRLKIESVRRAAGIFYVGIAPVPHTDGTDGKQESHYGVSPVETIDWSDTAAEVEKIEITDYC